MASDKMKRMLRSKGQYHTEEQLEKMSDRDCWAWIYERFPPETKKPKDNRPQVCFTGFNDTDRAALELQAAERFAVVSSVTAKLKTWLTGPQPRPVKSRKG